MAGIPITREVEIAVDWRELGTKLTEVLTQGFLTALGGDGVSGGISALIGAAGSIKADAEPGQKIWSLVLLCFAWTLDDLKSDGLTDIPGLRLALRDALDDARKSVDLGNQTCPTTFLERPTTLPLYKLLRDSVIAKKVQFRLRALDSDAALTARFDAAFNRSVFEILLKRADLYQSIAHIFSLPGIGASDFAISWETYKKNLIYDFEVKPVFGQEQSKISLSQLYVPLRGHWPRKETSEVENADRLSKSHDIGQLDLLLEEWLNSSNDEDWIRLIGGGPGSGKSTTLKAFARKVADRPDLRVLFIPLQHLDLEGSLRDAVNGYFTERSNSPFTQAPLSRSAIEDGPPLLLIFDGLDELARPGEAANEVVNLFATKLAHLNSGLKGDAAKWIRAVVSGRMPSFQAARRYLSLPKHGCIEVYGFTAQTNTDGNDDQLWALDQRSAWWKQYASLVGADLETPPAFSSERLSGITHEPLLCYLLVLSGFATENWQEAAENPNRIYRTLIDSVWERGWGDGAVKRQGPGKTLSKADFNDLMQAIGLAAWQGGDTRVASESAFTSAVETMQVKDAWQNFNQDNGSDVTNLAMNFYLKASETKQRGFEFTHKSFGDYLAARAILDFAEQLSTWINRKVDHAMTDWVAATGTGTLTLEILTFLRDEVRLRTDPASLDSSKNQQTLVANKRSFERFVSTILADGLPASNSTMIWRVAEARQRNAEIMAWAVLNSFSLGLASIGSDEKYVTVVWPDPNASFHQLLRRISSIRNMGNPALKCFSHILAPESDLFGLSLFGIDLRGAQMNGANFAGCHLIDANFEGANLQGANFQRAMLDRASLKDCSLQKANFIDARLEGVDFTAADLLEISVSLESMLHADLKFFATKGEQLRYDDDRFSRNGDRAMKDRVNRVRRFIGKLIDDRDLAKSRHAD